MHGPMKEKIDPHAEVVEVSFAPSSRRRGHAKVVEIARRCLRFMAQDEWNELRATNGVFRAVTTKILGAKRLFIGEEEDQFENGKCNLDHVAHVHHFPRVLNLVRGCTLR